MRAKPGWKDIDLTTRSGKVLRTSWANVRLSDGSLIGIGIDISSRKKMEESLLRLATAIDQADEGIMILNPEWEIDYVNPAYEALSEYRRDDLVGRPVFVLERFFMDSSYQDIIRSVKKEWPFEKEPSGEIIEINPSRFACFRKGKPHQLRVRPGSSMRWWFQRQIPGRR